MFLDVWEIAVMLVSQFAFFALGWIFFMKKLFKDYEINNKTVQVFFSATFSLSCTMFELIIFEILDVMNNRYEFVFNFTYRD